MTTHDTSRPLRAQTGGYHIAAPRKALTARSEPDGYGNPHNFLMKAGVRSFEHKIEQMNKAAVTVSTSCNEVDKGLGMQDVSL